MPKNKDSKLTKEEIKEELAPIAKAAGVKKITFRTKDEVDKFEVEINKILAAIGYFNAWISDQSMIADFPLGRDDLKRAEETLGVDVDYKDTFVEIAKRMRGK